MKKLFIAKPTWQGLVGAVISARRLGLLYEDEVYFSFPETVEGQYAAIKDYEVVYVVDTGRSKRMQRFCESQGMRYERRKEKRAGFDITLFKKKSGTTPFVVSLVRLTRPVHMLADRIVRHVPALLDAIRLAEKERTEALVFPGVASDLYTFFKRDLQMV